MPGTSSYQVVDAMSPQHIEQLHSLMDHEWWAKGRTLEEVQELVRNSQVNVCIVDTNSNDLVGYARVLTDYRYFSVILDVVVRPSDRGSGLGRLLMDTIMNHPKLQRLKGMGLQCEEKLIPFYAKWGFSAEVGRSRQMKRVFPDR